MPKFVAIFLIITFATFGLLYISAQEKSQKAITSLTTQKSELVQKLASVSAELNLLKNQDQVKRNDALEKQITAIETTYKKSVSVYQDLLDLKIQEPKLDSKFDTLLATAINQLADKNFASADSTLTNLSVMISTEITKIAAENAKTAAKNTTTANPETTPQNNTPPKNGFSRQTVHTDRGDFLVDLIAGSLDATKVVVDTASDSNCSNNCPVLSLGDYVSRSGAYAGVNGTYFCPADYPSCAGKTNSFDLLVMNKNKKYLNSDNNVYSTNPAVIFMNGSVRFVSQALQWGRDTSVDGVISNFPLLVSGGNIVFSDAGDAKQSSKGTRGYVANKGNTVYIGMVHNATVADSAVIMHALGMDNAMNLDSGGSAALMFNGQYYVGPGRNIPNSVLFLRK